MKLAEQIRLSLDEKFPKGARIGRKYKSVIVDGETFKGLELLDIRPEKSEMVFKGMKNHTFNYIEQEVILK